MKGFTPTGIVVPSEQTNISVQTRVKKGFTLAEVLITLAVIGIVSAITMPMLISKHEKNVLTNQIKSTASIFSQAIYKYMADEGVTDLSQSELNDNPEELKRFMKEYVKIVNDCNGKYYVKNKYTCFASNYTNLSKSGKWSFANAHGCQVVVTLTNGSAVCADLWSNSEVFLGLEIDVNGHKGPNVFGKDYQNMYIKKDGKLFDINWENRGKKICTNCGFDSGVGTFGQIMSDGWQIKYY